MKHKKCGGKFVRIEKDESKTVYQCNRCSAVRTIYKNKIATGGNLKKENKK